jgi:hypothetical protein
MAGAHCHVPRSTSGRFLAPTGPNGCARLLPSSGIHTRATATGFVSAPGTSQLVTLDYQQSLTNSFNTMALTPPPTIQDWVADLGASHHSTPSAGNISHPRTLTSFSPSSIIVGNGFTLPITSVGDSVLSGPFYLNNILLAPDLVQVYFLCVVLPLITGVLWSLTRLVCL